MFLKVKLYNCLTINLNGVDCLAKGGNKLSQINFDKNYVNNIRLIA